MDSFQSPKKRRRSIKSNSLLKQAINSQIAADPTYEELAISSNNSLIQPINSLFSQLQTAKVIGSVQHDDMNPMHLGCKQSYPISANSRSRTHKSFSPEAETCIPPASSLASRASVSLDPCMQPPDHPPHLLASDLVDGELSPRAYSSLPAPLSKSRLFDWMRRLLPNGVGASSKSRLRPYCVPASAPAPYQSHDSHWPASTHSTPPGAPSATASQVARASLEHVSCHESQRQREHSVAKGRDANRTNVSARFRKAGGFLSNAAALYGTLRRSVRGGGERKAAPSLVRRRGAESSPNPSASGNGSGTGTGTGSGSGSSRGSAQLLGATLFGGESQREGRAPDLSLPPSNAYSYAMLHSTYDLPFECDVAHEDAKQGGPDAVRLQLPLPLPVPSLVRCSCALDPETCELHQLSGGGGIYSTLNELGIACSTHESASASASLRLERRHSRSPSHSQRSRSHSNSTRSLSSHSQSQPQVDECAMVPANDSAAAVAASRPQSHSSGARPSYSLARCGHGGDGDDDDERDSNADAVDGDADDEDDIQPYMGMPNA